MEPHRGDVRRARNTNCTTLEGPWSCASTFAACDGIGWPSCLMTSSVSARVRLDAPSDAGLPGDRDRARPDQEVARSGSTRSRLTGDSMARAEGADLHGDGDVGEVADEGAIAELGSRHADRSSPRITVENPTRHQHHPHHSQGRSPAGCRGARRGMDRRPRRRRSMTEGDGTEGSAPVSRSSSRSRRPCPTTPIFPDLHDRRSSSAECSVSGWASPSPSCGPRPTVASAPRTTWSHAPGCPSSARFPSRRARRRQPTLRSRDDCRQGRRFRRLGGAALAAHESAVHGRRQSAANDRRHQPGAQRRQVDDRVQSRRSRWQPAASRSCSSTATCVARRWPRRWAFPAARG